MRNPNWTEEDIYRVAERGHWLHLQGRYLEAAIIFQGLVAADPEDRYSREALAAAWLALGQPERAIEHLDYWLSREPSDLAMRSRRMEAYLLSGNFSAAVRDFEYLRKVLPTHQVRRLELTLEVSARNPALFSGGSYDNNGGSYDKNDNRRVL